MAAVCEFCRQVFGVTSHELLVLEELIASDVRSPDTVVEHEREEAAARPECTDLESRTPLEEPLSKRPKFAPSLNHEVTTPPNLSAESCLDPVCVCCLGLNQRPFIAGLVSSISQKLEEADYRGVSSFVLAVHAPLSLKVRRMGMEYLMSHVREDMASSVSDREAVSPINSSLPMSPADPPLASFDPPSTPIDPRTTDLSPPTCNDPLTTDLSPPTCKDPLTTNLSPPTCNHPLTTNLSPPTRNDPLTTNLSPRIPNDPLTTDLSSPTCNDPLTTDLSPSTSKLISDEYYVKTNVRSRVRYEIEKCQPDLTYSVDSPFLITIKLDHVTLDQDCLPVIHAASISIHKPKVRWRHKGFKVQSSPTITTTAVNNALEVVTEKLFLENDYFLSAVSQRCSYEVEFLHKPIFIGGRYNKYSRTLPQTPWVIDGVRKAESSVEESICDKITDLVRATGHNFSSSGREDVDVRMLGNGRPFLVEFVNPRNSSFTRNELLKVQQDINSATDKVKVQLLQRVSKESTVALKEGEQEKQKTYSAFIWAPNRITVDDIKFLDNVKDLEIQQKTPIRVLHRRSLSTRLRSVFSLQTTFIDDHHFTLNLTTQAGMYVKEFVHGDFGRTQPNLRVLLEQDVDILRLDVLEVKLAWP